MSLNLSKDEQEKCVYYFKELIERTLKQRDVLDKTKLPEYWKRYEGDWSSKKDKDFPFVGAADFHVPFTTWATDAIDSRNSAAVFSAKDVCKIRGTTKRSKEVAPRVTQYINHYLLKKMDIEWAYSPWFLGSIVEGQRFLKTISQKKIIQRKRFRRDSSGMELLINKITGFFESDQRIIEKRETISTDVATKDFIFPTYARDIQTCPWIAERLYLTKYDMKQRVRTQGYISENIDKLPEKETIITTDMVKEFQAGKEGIREAQNLLTPYTPYEIWGRYKFKGDKEEKEYVFVIDIKNCVLLAVDENRFGDKRRPYVINYHRYIPQRILGQGLPRRLALMNDELDTLHNIVIDNSTLCNTLTFLYVEGKGFDPDRIKFKPGRGIPVDSLEGVFKQLTLGNPNLNVQQQESFVLSLLERLALVSDYNLGRESSQNVRPTARGTAMILHEFSVNFNKIAANTQRAVKQHILQVLEILYETLPKEPVPYYPNTETDEEVQFSRMDLEYIDDFEIIVLGDAVAASKQLQINNAIVLYDKLAMDQTGESNTLEVKKNLVDKIDRNLTSAIIRTPKELQQLQQAQQMLQQKAMALRQKELELNEREKINELKEMGLSPEQIEEEINKWRMQVTKEEQEAS